jgi:hypothetical protein
MGLKFTQWFLLTFLCSQITLGNEPEKITSDFLLSHGFIQEDNDRQFYKLSAVLLKNAAKDLGFSLEKMYTPPNGHPSLPDLRIVQIRDLHFVIRADKPNESLNNPDTICSISVSLNQIKTKDYLKTQSYPSLKIKSVIKPKASSQPLQVTLEITAIGKTPVALGQNQFSVRIFTDDEPCRFLGNASFETNTAQIFKVEPQKPLIISMSASTNRLGKQEHWSDLPSGNYQLSVDVNSGKDQKFDYQWLGVSYTDTYPLLIDK